MAQQLSESFQSGAFDDKAEKDAGLGDDSPTADEDICLGTPEWMAPELLDGPKNITRHADVYSFAMVLYELLTVRLTTFLPSGREPDCSVRNVTAFADGPAILRLSWLAYHRAGTPRRRPHTDLGESGRPAPCNTSHLSR